MINSDLVSPALTVPPQTLMDNTYSALKARVREALLDEWPCLFPPPGYYRHPPAQNPRPFMGLNKFIAGRIHQMRAGKSYLAAHPTWKSPDADTSCPRCGLESETFEHAILASLQIGRSLTPPPRRHKCRSQGFPMVLPTTPQKTRYLYQRHLHHIPLNYVSHRHSPLLPPVATLTPSSAPPVVSCFFVSGGLGRLVFFPATLCELSSLDDS